MLSWPGGFGDQNDDPRGSGYNNAQFDSDRNGSAEHLAPKKITDGETLNGPFDWAGVSDPFFAAVFLPESPATATIATLHGTLDVSREIKRAGMFGSGSAPTKAQDMPILGAALGDAGGPIETRIFVGPKAINVLKSVHAADPRITLEPDLEFGFWGPIAKYLFLSLQAIHAHITAGLERLLGLGNHRPHRLHQPAHPALPGQDHAQRAQDAAHPAADGRHQGEATRSTRSPTPSAAR